MPGILILGANGPLARNTVPFFLKQPDGRLTLCLRRAHRMKNPDPARVDIVRVMCGTTKFRESGIGASDLDYTIVRPAWFTRESEINYRITQKGEPFKGHEVSLDSLSELIVRRALTPKMEYRRSLGVSLTD